MTLKLTKDVKLIFRNQSLIVQNQISTEAFWEMLIIYKVRKLPRQTVNLPYRKFTDTQAAVLTFSSSDDIRNLKIILPPFMQHEISNIM